MKQTGILLINLGTPDSPETKDVRKYLTEFLNDSMVIDISPLSRWLLVNLLIVPFRSPKTAKLYKEIWGKEGSPLLIHGLKVKEKLQEDLGDNFLVELGMRYQKPSLSLALENLKKANVGKIIVLPLYPQYASSSTGSTIDKVMEIVRKWNVIPSMDIISKFYDHPAFIDAFVELGRNYNMADYDHILFSYHGLPERQILKGSFAWGKEISHSQSYCQLGECCNSISKDNQYCYRAGCFHTTRLLVEKLNIPKDKYTVSFQSRLGKDPWIKPYSDKVIIDLAQKGVKKLLVFSPAFVADCLETVYEIGVEYNLLFQKHGGEKIQLVESLNSHPKWIQGLKEMILEKS